MLEGSDQELLARVLEVVRSDPDSESEMRWEMVNALRSRATSTVFEAASRWCEDSEASRRELGADILGQLGVPDMDGRWPFGDRAVGLLKGMLADSEPVVLQSVIVALGHLLAGDTQGQQCDPEWFKSHAVHPDAEVREAVAWALRPQCGDSGVALEIMLRLMQDEQQGVRNWATFGVAQSDVDTDAVAGALFGRLTDAEEEVRAEALIGLARRQDERALALVDQALSGDEVSGAIVEAAAELGRPSLVPRLKELARSHPDDEAIAEALVRCGGILE